MDVKNTISLLCIVCPGLYFGFIGKPTEMGLAIVAGAIAAAFMNIDKIQRFKGAGFEAEMKKAVDEAYATLENLRELATPLLVSILANLTYFGRFGGMDPHRKHKFKDELKDIADKLSITDNELDEALKIFHRYHAWDHVSQIIDEVRKEQILPPDELKKLSEIKDYSSDKLPSVHEITNLIGEVKLPERIQLLFDDYEYYLTNKRLRKKGALVKE